MPFRRKIYCCGADFAKTASGDVIVNNTGVIDNANSVDNTEKIILPFEFDRIYETEKLDEVPKKAFYSFVKRAVDIVASFLAALVLLVPMAIIAIIVKATSPGPAFYCQERLGKNNKKFKVIKFRTMRADAEKMGAQWSGGEKDNRITKFGMFLRKTRLDELPQVFNILFGDMSLVGPRPEREVFSIEFEKYVHGFSQRTLVVPGLTGLAQVSGGYDLKPQEKIIYDIEYIKKRSLWLDLKIIFKTVAVVFTHEGAK